VTVARGNLRSPTAATLRSRPLVGLAIFIGFLCLTFAAYGPVVKAG
jgi:hypothetical protein